MHRLIILILFFSWVSHPVSLDAGPIDYFDITRPKFKPLPVVIRMNPANHLQGLYVPVSYTHLTLPTTPYV